MYIQVVKKVADDLDPDDFPFIALALKLNDPIWTNDRKIYRIRIKIWEIPRFGYSSCLGVIKGQIFERS